MSNSEALQWLGNVTPQTRAIAEEIVEHLDSRGLSLPRYGAPQNSPVMWGFNPGGAEHGTGRAIDVMVKAPGPVGEAVVDFVWANRERYDLTHIIWRQRIKSTQVQPGVWRAQADRGSPTENHMDHPHLFFGTEAEVTGSPAIPRKRVATYYQPTGTDLTVKEIQKIVGVKVDGYYGTSTKAAVADLQESLGVAADGLWGPATEQAYRAKSAPASAPAPTPTHAPRKPVAPRFPLPAGWYFGPRTGPRRSVSGYHGHRSDLRRWQRQMRARGWSLTADGLYGPKTEQAARQFQAEKGLPVDGLIGAQTWAAAWEEPVT